MKNFILELTELKNTLIHLTFIFLLVASILLFFTTGNVALFGVNIPVPTFGSPSIANEMFLMIKDYLVPAGVQLVTLSPISAFMAPILTAFLISLLLIFPYILYTFARFLLPALKENERKILKLLLIPSLALFYLGSALAFFVIIPKTFAILYSFASPMGVVPFFSLDEFISSVFLLTISVGVTFLLPVVMVVISRVNLVPRKFWQEHWRGAAVFVLIFSALVTPDGSGITMLFVSAPLILLYGAGAVATQSLTVNELGIDKEYGQINSSNL